MGDDYDGPEVAILTLGGGYSGPEVAMLALSGDYGGPELAILSSGSDYGDYGEPWVAVSLLAVTTLGPKWRL